MVLTGDDVVKIIGAVATATVLVLTALGALYVKIHSVGVSVNGRVDELVSASRRAGIAEDRLTQKGEIPHSAGMDGPPTV